MIKKLQLVGMILLLSSCGQGNAPGGALGSAPVVLRSPVQFEEPPDRTFTGAFVDGWRWSGLSSSNVLRLVDSEGNETSIQLPGLKLLFCQTRQVSQVDHLVFATLHANDQSKLYRIHDTTGDGLVDVSTVTELVSVDLSFVTSVSLLSSGVGFLLDHRCGDILRLEDSNADMWPDAVSTSPFALRTAWPALEFARSLRVVSSDEVIASPAADSGDAPTIVTNTGVYRDTDSDGVADEETETAYEYPPWWPGTPFDGQTSVSLAGDEGRTGEVWSVVGGTPGTLLGSSVFDANREATVSWVNGLVDGSQLAVKYATASGYAVFDVVDDWPQLLSIDGGRIVTIDDVALDLPVEGMNLSSTMTVELVSKDGFTVSLTFVVSSSTSATVTIPASVADHLGEGTIEAFETSQPTEERAFSLVVEICDPLGE